jgi:hypothetical protein
MNIRQSVDDKNVTGITSVPSIASLSCLHCPVISNTSLIRQILYDSMANFFNKKFFETIFIFSIKGLHPLVRLCMAIGDRSRGGNQVYLFCPSDIGLQNINSSAVQLRGICEQRMSKIYLCIRYVGI